MAALLSTGVTSNDRFNSIANTGGKRSTVDATLALVSQGGATNYIAASLFGLATIDAVLSAVADDNTIYTCSPSYDRTKLLFSGGDITKTVRVVLVGTPNYF